MATGQQWKIENRARYNAWARKWGKAYRAKLRADALEFYGGKCACCGESEPMFLTIDHVDGGGGNHRREIGNGGAAINAFLRRKGYPKDGFQILCHNCNCAKGFYGACPHTTSQPVQA